VTPVTAAAFAAVPADAEAVEPAEELARLPDDPGGRSRRRGGKIAAPVSFVLRLGPAWPIGNEVMFERVLSFLRDLPAGGARADADDPRVAASALLYHVMNADGVRQDVEWERFKQVLAQSYSISGLGARCAGRRRRARRQ